MSTSAAALTPTIAAAKLLVEEQDHVSSDELAAILAGAPTRHHLAHLRRSGALLALRFAQRGFLYPSFQVDRELGRVEPSVARINRLLLRRMPVHEAVVWWSAPPSDDARPRSLMITLEPAVLLEFLEKSRG